MANRDERYQALLEERRKAREAEEAKRKAEQKKKTLGILLWVGLGVIIIAVAVLLVLHPWQKTTFTSSTDKNNSTVSDVSDAWADWEFKHDMEKKHNVAIEVKDYGTIKLELDPTYAPITVDNFLCLVEEGFYDGLTFHRILNDSDPLMIQGGDPDGNGTGGSSVNIKGEFSQNGVNNPLSHKRGVISMARSNHPDSASSQFFICHGDCSMLDGGYASFGVVTEGMDVVDAIAADANPGYNGAIASADQPVITKVTIID